MNHRLFQLGGIVHETDVVIFIAAKYVQQRRIYFLLFRSIPFAGSSVEEKEKDLELAFHLLLQCLVGHAKRIRRRDISIKPPIGHHHQISLLSIAGLSNKSIEHEGDRLIGGSAVDGRPSLAYLIDRESDTILRAQIEFGDRRVRQLHRKQAVMPVAPIQRRHQELNAEGRELDRGTHTSRIVENQADRSRCRRTACPPADEKQDSRDQW